MFALSSKRRRVQFFDGGEDQLLSAGDVFARVRDGGDNPWRIEVQAGDEGAGLLLALKAPQGEVEQTLLLPGERERWSLGALRRYPPALGLIELMCEKAPKSGEARHGRAVPRSSRTPLIMSSLALALSVLALGVSVYGFAVSLAGTAQSPTAMAASVPAPESLMGMKVADDQLGPVGLAIMKDAAARSGFSLNPEGQLVVMFADPLCAACKQFEEWIEADEYKTFAPLVVPVAFRPGAQEPAAAVLCSKEQAKDWRRAVAGETLQACEDGRRQVELNNAAFEALGLGATPAFVAMNGKILVGARSPEEMAKWADENTPPGMIPASASTARESTN